MILLSTTADQLNIATSSTSEIDVQVSAMDMNISNTDRPVGYRKNTAISSISGSTNIAASPGASTIRTVKTISVRNKGVATNVVTISHTDGITSVEMVEAILAPNMGLQYNESNGWSVTDSDGRVVVVNYSYAGAPIVDGDTVVRLASDVVNNNGVANTIQDVTGLSFSVTAGKMYWFEFYIKYTAAATSTGSRWAVSGPAGLLSMTSEYSLTTTTNTRNALVQGFDLPAACNATSAATTNNLASMIGIFTATSSGTLIARFASEVLSSAITAKADSFVRYRQITP